MSASAASILKVDHMSILVDVIDTLPPSVTILQQLRIGIVLRADVALIARRA